MISLSFVLSTCGVFFCYLLYSIFQEQIYKYEDSDGERFSYSPLLLCMQCTFNLLSAFLFTKISGSSSGSSSVLSSESEKLKGDAMVGRAITVTASRSSSSSNVTIISYNKTKKEYTIKNSDGSIETTTFKNDIVKYTKTPWYRYAEISFTYIAAMLASNEALKYVNYPTQALGKSAKIIPVMLVSFLVYGRKYKLEKWFCMLLITFGVFLFQYFKPSSKVSVENTSYGLLLLAFSLICDGLLGPRQDQIRRLYKPNSITMGMFMNLFAVIYLVILLVGTNQFSPGITYLMKNHAILDEIMIICCLSAVGQNCILFLVSHFGSLVCTTVTTTRKFFTILASVLLFGNPLQPMQWTAVFVVFSGLSYEVYSKYRQSKNQQGVGSKKKD